MRKVNVKHSIQWSYRLFIPVLAASLLVGCQSSKEPSTGETAAAPAMEAAKAPAPAPETPAPAAPVVAPPTAAPEPAPAPPAPPVTATAAAVTNEPATAPTTIRIKAGTSAPYTDSNGNVWLADQGFEGGDTSERPSDLQIAETKDPGLYRTERYGMTAFSYKLPNGKYTVKLHFAESFEGITGPGQRVFSFNVEGHEFKDFDVFVKAGGARRAYIETVEAEVTDGKLDITFTRGVENPEINGIEIIPGS